MKEKDYFISAGILGAVLLVITTCLCQIPSRERPTVGAAFSSATPPGKFGPVMDVVLPSDDRDESQIFDLETGRLTRQKPSEYFGDRPIAVMAWIRSNGLDISSNVWKTGAACITYDMVVVAVPKKTWNDATEEELRNNPALASKRHSPRRMLVLGSDQPDTYLFRTGEGTLGILHLTGLSEDGRGVKIRYKLIR